MNQFRFAILAVFLLFPASAALAQDEAPPEIQAVPAAKAPAQSLKPLLFSAGCIGLALGFMAALTATLALAYRANKISGPTVCFILGGVLVLSPVYGTIVFYLGQVVATADAFVALGEVEGAPNANVMANQTSNFLWMTVSLTIFSFITYLAAPVGVVAIVAAFFFKKPAS